MRRTKIVCTIGPASARRPVLARLIRAGMDVARLNFSHGTHEQHAEVIAGVRALGESLGRPVAVLQDLSGPKVRLGAIAAGPITLRRGQSIRLTGRDVPGDSEEVSLPVPELLAALRPGDRLHLDDGKVELQVVSADGADVVARATVAGELSSRKGVTAPGVALALPAVMPGDLDDLRFGLRQGVDWVAASYVREAGDLTPLRSVMREEGAARPIIAKIEKLEALHNLAEIVRSADGVMVARGDLGVEMPIHQVPLAQKRIIRACNRAGKPVITATQMLDSMMANRRPTRAEASDVANAILDGTDAVMLSGETAVGRYPVEATRMMAAIAREVDPELTCAEAFDHGHGPAVDSAEAVARAAVEMARALEATAVVCATTSGATARRIARHRPGTPVVAATPSVETLRQLALVWGVRPLLVPPCTNSDDMMTGAIDAAGQRGWLREGHTVVLTAGVPVNIMGNTNLIRVHVVGRPLRPAR
ncbi:MAG: pyruvate kinase [Chthonomonadales bacterium]|nr:pyruvate kinase [Chthonomonadales bacterium]